MWLAERTAEEGGDGLVSLAVVNLAEAKNEE